MKIAVHGLGRMGMQIARKLAESGQHEVFAHNRSQAPIDSAVDYGAVAAPDKASVCQAFGSAPGVVWVMLPAAVTEEEVGKWAAVLPPGSVIINGGNCDYRATRALAQTVASAGHTLVDIGVSGGLGGYEKGFPLMCGCDDPEAFATIVPVLEVLRQPGGAYKLFGPSGAGHYVKMVHNAIEYGMMQSLGEGYQLLAEGPYAHIDVAAVAGLWQHESIVASKLNGLCEQVFHDNPRLDGVSGVVADSGEARWAVATAKGVGMSLPCIEQALAVRLASQHGSGRTFATKVVAAQRHAFGGHDINGEGSGA